MKKLITDLIYFVSGCFVYSAAVTMLISANEISPGGFTGIATLLNYAFSLPVGAVLLLLNIPVLILGFIKFGKAFIIKTALVTVLASVSLTVTEIILPPLKMDKILAAIFGGILMGTGLSLVMLRGATTGGVDIIAKLINRRMRHLTVGRIILIIDSFVIALAALVYRNAESALFSVVCMYSSSHITDTMLYGADKGKLIHIVTSSPDEICADINGITGRGVTVLDAKGGYTGKSRTLLLCTVRRHEVMSVYSIIETYDKNAFITVSDAGEIIGEGFKDMS